MQTTYCEKCIFSQEVSSDNPCEFNIPNLLKHTKDLSIDNNFYIIKNYTCLYGFGKNQYDLNNKDLQNIDIKEIITKKTHLKYYLVIDARTISDIDLGEILTRLNNLSIKPKKLSILVNPNSADNFYETIKNNLNCPKWTIHIFINEISFNNCINIILDTNLPNCDAWCVIFYDANRYKNNSNSSLDLENIIDVLHKKIIIKQESFQGVMYNKTDLHGLCLNCSVYKFITSVLSNDILNGLSQEPHIVLSNYEAE